MTHTKAQQILRDAGFPIVVDGKWGLWSKRALRDACRGFAWTQKQTGFKRPRVGGRLTKSRERMLLWIKDNQGRCSPHFRYVEFRCKGALRGMPHLEDNWIRVARRLILRLETYRAAFGPVTIISGGRSTAYNKAVGGASLSQHRYAFRPMMSCKAVDVNPVAHHTEVRKIWGTGGIGYNQSTGKVAHVDVRRTNALWSYAR